MNDAPTCGAAGCGWDDPSVRGVAPVAFAAPTHLTDWTFARRPDVMSMLTRSRRIDITFNVMITMKAQPYRSLRMWVVNYIKSVDAGRLISSFISDLATRFTACWEILQPDRSSACRRTRHSHAQRGIGISLGALRPLYRSRLGAGATAYSRLWWTTCTRGRG